MIEEDWKIFCFFAIPLTWLALFGVGWCTGNDVATKSIRQDLCKATMEYSKDYINCNTKSLDEIIQNLRNVR